jgi:hypothetical protein
MIYDRLAIIIVFVTGIITGVILSPLLVASVAHGASSGLSQVSSSTFRFSFNDGSGNESGASSQVVIIKNTYPNSGPTVAGALSGPTYTGNRIDLINSLTDQPQGLPTATIDMEARVGSNGDGTYWLLLQSPFPAVVDTIEWYSMTRVGGVWSLDFEWSGVVNNVGFNKNTRFIDATATTTGTSTIDFDVSWLLDANEINSGVSALNPTGIKIQFSERPTTNLSARTFTIASTTGTSSDIFSIPLDDFGFDGVFDIAIRFTNVACDLGFGDCPFPDSYLYFSVEMASGTIVALGNTENYNTVDVQPEQETCSITNITACIVNALVYVFVPSQGAIDDVLDVRGDLDNVIPFGYFTQALDAINGIDASTTPAYIMPEIPFQEAIFDPLKDGLSVMLWGVFAFVFYNKRLKNIDI